MTDLERLSSRLAASIGEQRAISGLWDNAGPIAAQVVAIRARFGSRMGDAFNRTVMTRAVAKYRRRGSVGSILELRYVCLGAGYFSDEGYCLLGDAPRIEALLNAVETVPGRTNRMRMYRALLRSYWAFPLHGQGVPEDALNGWKFLRAWLKTRYDELVSNRTRKPVWFSMLAVNLDLLTEVPCARFSQELLDGNARGLQRAIDTLQIPEEAWVKDEAVLAQIRAGIAQSDDGFKRMLPRLMDVAAGKAGIDVTQILASKCLAILVARWAKCHDYQPNPDLFVRSLDLLGAPWTSRPTWDSLIIEANLGNGAEVREMVANWLKEKLIDRYFLAYPTARGMAELWKMFSVFIEELWVGIADVESDTGLLLQYARHCPIPIQAGQPSALLIRIGEYLVIARGAVPDRVVVLFWHQIGTVWLARLRSGRDASPLDLEAMLLETPHLADLYAGDVAQLEGQVRSLLLPRHN